MALKYILGYFDRKDKKEYDSEKLYHFHLIEKYFRKNNPQNCLQIITDRVCNDLDFQDLFMFTDRTVSKVGQQYLYNKMRIIPNDTKSISSDEIIIESYYKNPGIAEKCSRSLKKLDTGDAYLIASLFQDLLAERPKWFKIIWFLSFTNLVSLLLIFVTPWAFVSFLILSGLNLVVHLANKKKCISIH